MSTNQTNGAGERHEFVGGSPPTFPDLCEFLGGEDVCQLPRSAPVHETKFKRVLNCHSCGLTHGSDSFECFHCGSLVTEICL